MLEARGRIYDAARPPGRARLMLCDMCYVLHNMYYVLCAMFYKSIYKGETMAIFSYGAEAGWTLAWRLDGRWRGGGLD